VKYQAVIFDLGGTLSRSAPWDEYRNAAGKMAAVCSLPEEKFVDLWFSESSGLGLGLYPRYQDYIKRICKTLNINVVESLIETAGDIPIAITKQYVIAPREGALELLSYLKANNYKIGLISDCAPDLPQIWGETLFAPYFDATVFSCQVGMNKADPRIFHIALEKLDVKPENCIYIADGMRNELSNAALLGMTALQLYLPEENDDSPIREDWQGEKISSLQEVFNLLK
jgi:putative hydrolase of the HAD superfamily